MNSKAREMLVVREFPHFSTGGQQRLRGNTTPVHTGTTHIAGFNDRRLQAVFGRMFGCVEAAVAGSNNNDVEIEAGVAHPNCCDVAVIVARRRSKRRGTAADATFKDSTRGLWGNVTAWVQQAWRSR